MPDQEERTLGRIDLFAGLPAETVRKIEQDSRWRIYGPDEQILARASESRDVHFVARGEVQVVNYSLTGREIAFARVRSGGYFGELAAIDGAPRSADVVAVTESLIATLSPAKFQSLLSDYPALAMQVLARLAQIVRACNDRIMDLGTFRAVQRVHIELLRLAKRKAPDDGDWIIQPLPTHKDIASRAVTSRETVTRVISQLARDGVVERKGNTLLIRGRETLERLAEGGESEPL